MAYRILDHTADFGIEVTAGDPDALFAEAAGALFDLIVERRGGQSGPVRSVTAEGRDWADLLVNWLRALLDLWNGDQLLVCDVFVEDIGPRSIRADVRVDRFDSGRHPIENEVKAVTYHQVRVEETAGKWTARFIVDV